MDYIDSPGKNAEVGCLTLLQGIFLTQGANPGLLPWKGDSLLLSHWGRPRVAVRFLIKVTDSF